MSLLLLLTSSGGPPPPDAAHRRPHGDGDDSEITLALARRRWAGEDEGVTWNPMPGGTAWGPLQPLAGAYTLTGQAAALRRGRPITAATGTYSLTGQSATLTYSGSNLLAADAGAYAVAGQAAMLSVARRLTAAAGAYSVTGVAAGFRATRRLTGAAGSYTLTGAAATLTDSGAFSSLGQYLIEMSGTLTRYTINELTMPTTITTSSAYLWLTEDQEAEYEFSRKSATTGVLEAASGLTGMTVHISATAGGAAIGALTFALTERGTTGVYYAVLDTATLVAGLSAATYPDGTALYLVVSKSGDIASRSFRRLVKRQRVGDG